MSVIVSTSHWSKGNPSCRFAHSGFGTLDIWGWYGIVKFRTVRNGGDWVRFWGDLGNLEVLITLLKILSMFQKTSIQDRLYLSLLGIFGNATDQGVPGQRHLQVLAGTDDPRPGEIGCDSFCYFPDEYIPCKVDIVRGSECCKPSELNVGPW